MLFGAAGEVLGVEGEKLGSVWFDGDQDTFDVRRDHNCEQVAQFVHANTSSDVPWRALDAFEWLCMNCGASRVLTTIRDLFGKAGIEPV
jgi:hypothetical protein